MLCDVCKQNTATIHMFTIVDGKQRTLNICPGCILKQKEETEDISIGNVISSMFSKPEENDGTQLLACKNCGMSYSEFKQDGKLGCAECYSAFRMQLEPILKNIHGRTRHEGTIIPGARKMREIEDIKLAMHAAVDREDFEAAALLRDKLRELEEKNKEDAHVECP